MMTAFNLKSDTSLADFRAAYDRFVNHMVGLDLALGSGLIGRRDPQSDLDTDNERVQQFFAIMEFESKQQSEQAFAWIKSAPKETDYLHRNAWGLACDMVFIAWEDIE